MFVSWMNDSGFWVVGRLSGFAEKETLTSRTVVVTVNSVPSGLYCHAVPISLKEDPSVQACALDRGVSYPDSEWGFPLLSRSLLTSPTVGRPGCIVCAESPLFFCP